MLNLCHLGSLCGWFIINQNTAMKTADILIKHAGASGFKINSSEEDPHRIAHNHLKPKCEGPVPHK